MPAGICVFFYFLYFGHVCVFVDHISVDDALVMKRRAENISKDVAHLNTPLVPLHLRLRL